MTEMIERVAEAIRLELASQRCMADGVGRTDRQKQLRLAVAAIEAMREPTEAMKEAASRDAAQAHYETHPSTAGWLYTTMIYEALKP